MINLSEKWKLTCQSICLIEHFKVGKRIGTGTGFRIKGKIITNNHVFQSANSDSVSITFVQSDCTTVSVQKTYTKEQFESLLIIGDHKDNWDYAILDGTDPEFNIIPPLQLANNHEVKIGSNVYFLGYPLFKNNLMISEGTIASKYIKAGVKYIQLNANVNNGNSGGPLFDYETDSIIGIVTRKNTGLSERFDKLTNSFKGNIEQIKRAQQGVHINFGGVNPIQGLEMTQVQFTALCTEIIRSSNVGIGYAFELEKINNDLQE